MLENQIPRTEENDRFLLGEMLAVVMEYRWLVLSVTLLAVILGFFWVFISIPSYRAEGLIQVEEKASGVSALKELQPLLGDDTTIAAELEILPSRMILERVIAKLKLDVEIVPKYFPVLGVGIARRYVGSGVNEPVLGLKSYAWGGERWQLDELNVPQNMLDLPLILVAKGDGVFELQGDDDVVLLQGRIGSRVAERGYSVILSRLDARPNTRFVVVKQSPEAAVSKLREKFTTRERGKKSGILEVSLVGRDISDICEVLNEILRTYVKQNVERRSAEAENTLKFLETQLPLLKKELDSAEAAYNAYRQSRGSLDLTIETQSVLASIVEVDNQIVALKQERDELRQNFTAEHPRIQAVDQRLERLRDRRKVFDGDITNLPDTQQKVLRLARDVEVSTTLYTNLVNTAQQLKVSKAGTVGDVRIIDSAAASKMPISLKPSAAITIALLMGLFISLALIWVIKSLRVFVEDPETIEENLGLPVYATVPHSPDEEALFRRAKARKGAEGLLALTHPEDDAIESLRGLRTTIHFALMDSVRNSILITGSSPGLGKSFISKNLGAVIAQAGKRVVVVDADLRKGHINKEFGIRRECGVSEYVTGAVSLENIIKPTAIENFWVVTTGQIPPNPSELLMQNRFADMINLLEKQFDTVIIDAPPILAVSDAAIIGRNVGATLMVVRAGVHPIKEIEQAVKRLNHGGVQVKGIVFNDYDVNRQRYRYGYKGYVYRYSYGVKK